MHRDATRRLYDVHSWAGLVFGVLVTLICVSGAVAVFKTEIDLWANPSLNVPMHGPPAVDMDAALASIRAYLGDPNWQPRFVHSPEANRALYEFFAPGEGNPLRRLYVHAYTGEVLNTRGNYVFQFMRDLHVRLMLPAYGRLVVGIIGVAMLISIITGVLIHKHLFRDLFRMRWNTRKGPRKPLSDLHKLVGVWALLFHFVLSATGAWLGLEAYLSRGVAIVAYGGDIERARRDLLPPPTNIGSPADMPALAPLLVRARKAIPRLDVGGWTFHDWGHNSARVEIRGDVPGTLLQTGTSHVEFVGPAAQLGEVRDMRKAGPWGRIRASLEPLHYGYFGGLGVKIAYLVLGLLPAILSITGAIIWFDRRNRLAPGE